MSMRKQRACKLREPMVPDTVSVTVFWAEVSEHIDGKKRSARRKLARTPCVTHQNATVLCFTRMPHGSDNAEVDFQEVQAPADAQDNKPNGEKGSLLTKKLLKLQKSYARRGVIYISRIPPHMKPQKLRHLLEQYGAIGRVYCAPEDPALRKQRKQKGGNTGKNFTEGWVEFEDKAVAKSTAAMLNGNPIGGKRRSAYHYDLWSLKYLPKFKWDHLTEEITYQNAVREQKLAAEVSAAKRERDFYMGQVDKAKGMEAMAERKRKRDSADADAPGRNAAEQQRAAISESDAKPAGGAADTAAPAHHSKQRKTLRTYGQKKAKADPAAEQTSASLTADFLALIGGKR